MRVRKKNERAKLRAVRKNALELFVKKEGAKKCQTSQLFSKRKFHFKKTPSRKKRAAKKTGLKIKKREGIALNFVIQFLGALNLYKPIPIPIFLNNCK